MSLSWDDIKELMSHGHCPMREHLLGECGSCCTREDWCCAGPCEDCPITKLEVQLTTANERIKKLEKVLRELRSRIVAPPATSANTGLGLKLIDEALSKLGGEV